jgi:hypothetical protein
LFLDLLNSAKFYGFTGSSSPAESIDKSLGFVSPVANVPINLFTG